MTNQKQASDIETRTTECVRKLNEQTVIEQAAWIERGRLISDYIEAAKKSGETTDQALKRLEAHPDALHQYSQLRNFKLAYDVYRVMAAEAGVAKLSMTHFVAVQAKGLDHFKKAKLLKTAAQEHQSVSELKAAIKEMLGNGPSASSEAVVFLKRLQQAHADLIAVFDPAQQENVPDHIRDAIFAALQRILVSANSMALVDVAELQAQNTAETANAA